MSEVSIIISARNEFPNIAHTINNLMLDCWQSGIERYEFILADNASTDNTTKFFTHAFNNPYAKQADHQVPNELRPGLRGLANEGRLRFVYDAIFSNVGARHKAVEYARYKNIIFSDAHMAVKPGSIALMLETLEKYGGIIHAPVAWLGASMDHPHPGIQYTYKVGEKVYGTWNYATVTGDAPFYIPGSGHCFMALNKKEYLHFGGYDTHQRVYGGGEPYLDTLYWLMGSTVMVDPRALVFHLSAGRGYNYDMNSLIHNMMLTAYALGGHKWSERVLITYLNKSGVDRDFLYKMYDNAIKEGQEKREFIERNQKITFEEFLAYKKPYDCNGKEYKMQAHARRIWDIKNDELHGNHISFVVVFEEWLERLQTEEAKDFYKNSSYQKQ